MPSGICEFRPDSVNVYVTVQKTWSLNSNYWGRSTILVFVRRLRVFFWYLPKKSARVFSGTRPNSIVLEMWKGYACVGGSPARETLGGYLITSIHNLNSSTHNPNSLIHQFITSIH